MPLHISSQNASPHDAVAGPPPLRGGTSVLADHGAPRHPLLFALALTGLAGFLDAAAYVHVDHIYVSFMSGNSTHLGMSLASLAIPDIVFVLGVISAFVGGSAAGTWIADHSGERLVAGVLCVEAVLLALAIGAALTAHPRACVTIVALTMGIQNVLHQAVGGVDVGKGFVTGMLAGLGQSMARLPEGKTTLRGTLTYLVNWMAFVAGAAGGALAIHRVGFTGCLLAGAAIVVVMLAIAIGRSLGRSAGVCAPDTKV